MLNDLNLRVGKHEVVCLIGPSGCGKSTMLRCVNGLESIQTGAVFVGDLEVSSPIVDMNAVRRRVGMVFQHFNLFPHMTAIENVMVAQRRVLGRDKGAARDIAFRLLSRVGLSKKVGKYPEALSGGEQQRVAIARTLAMSPQALLLDEITSALDPELVGEVLEIVRELANEGMTMLLATHEMSFAREVATRVCFVADGSIYEEGPAEKILSDPDRPKTQAFLRRLVESHRL
ncbi:amino acid ABC transporter ATP-binding protein [Planotetraspora sp. GP83]|uniref:amino acid ABC transporter ATP-binding protein n=1 Tax=Planotetraspora sp. GP83 TaxID=3156264 RepID=UPI00351154A4